MSARWDAARVWLWHVFNDPMRHNPWSIVMFLISACALIAGAVLLDRGVTAMRFGRRDDDVSQDGARAADTIAAARAETEQPQARPATLADIRDEPEPQGRRHTAEPEDTSTRMQRAQVKAEREPCPHCRGKGFVMTTSDLLRESAGLIADRAVGDAVVQEFYRRLLAADAGKAPGDRLAPLFPADLLAPRGQHAEDTSEGLRQRDRLYDALVALASLYDPADDAGMLKLTNALGAFGRSHRAFPRPDGTVRDASLAEYAGVREVLFGTLHDIAGDAWLPDYDAAWAEAYDFAASFMLQAAFRAGATTMTRPLRASGDEAMRRTML